LIKGSFLNVTAMVLSQRIVAVLPFICISFHSHLSNSCGARLGQDKLLR
jgi:hypothetical protein